jgi:hypothetical protein
VPWMSTKSASACPFFHRLCRHGHRSRAGRGCRQPPGNPFPFDADTFDLAVSTSSFEHDQCFWFTFTEAIRTLKAGGHFFLNAPSNGPYHGYPFDNWRFYPDAARALVAWAERGYQVRVVESGTLRQVAGSCARLARMVRLGAVPDRCRVPVCLDRLFGGRHPQPASRSGALGSGASRRMPCTHYRSVKSIRLQLHCSTTETHARSPRWPGFCCDADRHWCTQTPERPDCVRTRTANLTPPARQFLLTRRALAGPAVASLAAGLFFL